MKADGPSKKKAKASKPVKEAQEPTEPATEEVEEVQEPTEPATEEVEEHLFSDDEEEQALILAGITDNDGEDEIVHESVAFKEGQDVGKAPKPSKAVVKAAREKGPIEDTGVVYFGRLPHGFYEHELRLVFATFLLLLHPPEPSVESKGLHNHRSRNPTNITPHRLRPESLCRLVTNS